jgi:hypothetical protein
MCVVRKEYNRTFRSPILRPDFDRHRYFYRRANVFSKNTKMGEENDIYTSMHTYCQDFKH